MSGSAKKPICQIKLQHLHFFFCQPLLSRSHEKKSVDHEERSAAIVALGQQIRKVRQERGISQEGFAAQAGIARSYYGGIEREEQNVAALNLMRIAVALNVEVGDLYPSREAISGLLNSPTASM